MRCTIFAFVLMTLCTPPLLAGPPAGLPGTMTFAISGWSYPDEGESFDATYVAYWFDGLNGWDVPGDGLNGSFELADGFSDTGGFDLTDGLGAMYGRFSWREDLGEFDYTVLARTGGADGATIIAVPEAGSGALLLLAAPLALSRRRAAGFFSRRRSPPHDSDFRSNQFRGAGTKRSPALSAADCSEGVGVVTLPFTRRTLPHSQR